LKLHGIFSNVALCARAVSGSLVVVADERGMQGLL